MNPESVLNVLMYLFMHHMRNNCDISKEQDTLFDELEHFGFEPNAIIQALSWLANLSVERRQPPAASKPDSFRVYSDYECEMINQDCRHYIYQLEHIGILDAVTRESVIHQIVDLRDEGIDVSLVKWVSLLVLFNQPNAQEALAQMELLVLEQPVGGMH
jgi:Smg protein